MTRRKPITLPLWACLAAFRFLSGSAPAAGETNVESQVRALQSQNDALQSQLRQQQELIDSLRRDVGEIRDAASRRDRELDDLKSARSEPENNSPGAGGFHPGKVDISGEGAAAFFETGNGGAFPHNEFRVDEAKLFVESPVWENVYAYAEINLASHESANVSAQLGEFYVDFEDVSQLWGRDRQLNVRAGRLDVPFGEEYITRDAIDNPLISHSLSDFWGVDEGLEVYGALGKFSYAVAVQNGGVPDTRDFDSDKSIAGRLSFDPNRWLHFSVSGLRTGDLKSKTDGLSAEWFGGAWFRPLGTATVFHANVAEADVHVRLPHGHVKAFGGYIRYGDNDLPAHHRRDVYYYAVEGLHEFTPKFYAAARFSQIFAEDGFPVVGNGSMEDYLYGPLADNLWRLTLGLGYRWNRHLVVKTEYSLERGGGPGGEKRNREDLFAAEAAFGF